MAAERDLLSGREEIPHETYVFWKEFLARPSDPEHRPLTPMASSKTHLVMAPVSEEEVTEALGRGPRRVLLQDLIKDVSVILKAWGWEN